MKRWLACCLVVLLPCLGLGIAQRQTLGPLHVHATPAAAAGQAGATLLHQALGWWWAQVRTQAQARQHARAHAHGEEHAHAKTTSVAHAHVEAVARPAAHDHSVWQRHRHSQHDASVIALDATGEDPRAQGAAASLLLSVLGAPASGLRIDAADALPLAWPRAGAARFSSWGVAPPLRPPRG
jgi:hypothetical protein